MHLGGHIAGGGPDHESPLHLAAVNPDPKVIGFGAAGAKSLEDPDKQGRTPLDVAVYWNNVPAARWLLAHGPR